MLDVKSYIYKRKNYELPTASNPDRWIEEIGQSELRDEVFFIAVSGAFTRESAERSSLLKKYHIAGLFDLRIPYCNRFTSFVLVYITAKKSSEVKIANYYGQAYDSEQNGKSFTQMTSSSEHLKIPEKYTEDYSHYIHYLECWINNGIKPEENNYGKYKFNTVSPECLDYDNLYTEFYSKKAQKIKELAGQENFVKLADVADILLPRELKNDSEKIKRLTVNDFSYPLHLDSLQKSAPTDVILQKGDIIFPRFKDPSKMIAPYFYDVDSQEPVCTNPSNAVIRCRDVSPEYLFRYLASDTVNYYMQVILQRPIGLCIEKNDLSNIPVAIPRNRQNMYRQEFEILYTQTNEKNYKNYRQYSKYQIELDKGNIHSKTFEDIIDIEYANKIKAFDEEWLRLFLTDDLIELNTCFSNGAYKAAMILAGSILEAVLIDWISEIYGINYFDNDYKVQDERSGRSKNADLIDYIKEIAKLEYPEWIEEADKSHKIRKKRNLVHAKLCKGSDEINEAACKQVIDYLQDILKTRGVTVPKIE